LKELGVTNHPGNSKFDTDLRDITTAVEQGKRLFDLLDGVKPLSELHQHCPYGPLRRKTATPRLASRLIRSPELNDSVPYLMLAAFVPASYQGRADIGILLTPDGLAEWRCLYGRNNERLMHITNQTLTPVKTEQLSALVRLYDCLARDITAGLLDAMCATAANTTSKAAILEHPMTLMAISRDLAETRLGHIPI
jgi:hypothetical protein